MVRKWLETLALVKPLRGFIRGVEDHRDGSDLASHGSVKRVCRKTSTIALASALLVDGKPAERSCGNERIARQPKCIFGVLQT